jgi:ABC-2 type transport system ATP-binding protein
VICVDAMGTTKFPLPGVFGAVRLLSTGGHGTRTTPELTAAGGSVIEVRGLTKTYGDQRAVDDLSFTAPAGRVTGFLGPNGAGKTTTFRCLLGLAEPTSGTVLIAGRPYRDLPSPRRKVGAVLETTGFHPGRSARNHLRVIARAARLDPSRIDSLLDVVGLSGAAERRVGGYSLGMRQRLSLAAAMLGDPEVVVLDEPANGLDPEGVTWIRRILRIWADEGRTMLVASHVLAEVGQVVDRVVIIRAGRLVAEIDIADLTDSRVTVRVDRLDPMLDALRAAGADHQLLADGAISVTGRDTSEIGGIAARAGVTVTELAKQSAGDSLEALFLDAIGGNGQ